MTVASATNRVQYAGDGVVVAFPTTFKFTLNADIKVVLLDALGVETTQTETTHYTLTGAGVDAGGTVTMITAPASGETLTITRDVAITQGTDYVTNDPFPAEVHEAALDKLTYINQDQQEILDRSLVLKESDESAVMELPLKATRANKYLAFDVNGLPVESTGTGTDTGLRADLASLTSAVLGSALIGVYFAVAGYAGRKLSEWISDRPYSVKDFGALGDGVWSNSTKTFSGTNDDTAFAAAIAAAGVNGIDLYIPPGNYMLATEIDIQQSGVVIHGANKGGKPDGADERVYGSRLVINGALTNALFNFLQTTGGGNTDGNQLKNVDIYGQNRTVAADAIRVAGCDGFHLENVKVQRLQGSAIKLNSLTKGIFLNIDIHQCGATNKPSFYMPDDATNFTQGTHFTNINVEVDYSNDTNMYIGTGHKSNHYTSLVLENDAVGGTAKSLIIAGDRNTFVGGSFNRSYNTTQKVLVSGDSNIISAFYFREPELNSVEMLVSGNENQLQGITFWNQGFTPDAADALEISGNYNITKGVLIRNIGQTALITLTGSFNLLDGVILRSAIAPCLLVSGTDNKITNVKDVSNTYSGSTAAVTLSGARSVLNTCEFSYTSTTGDLILMSGVDSRVRQCTLIGSSGCAYGIQVTALKATISNNKLRNIGQSAVHLPTGASLRRFSDNEISAIGLASAGTYYILRWEGTSSDAAAGAIVSNNLLAAGSNLAGGLWVADDAGGNENHIANVTGNCLVGETITWVTGSGSTVANNTV